MKKVILPVLLISLIVLTGCVSFFDFKKELTLFGELESRLKSIDLESVITTDESLILWTDDEGYFINFPAREELTALPGLQQFQHHSPGL